MKTISIKDLVFNLPEVYQPIYGHADLDVNVSRSCEDRLEKILEVYSALESFLGRPLKVLDLGCAQGFFSLNLAKKGAFILGIDYLDKNIAVCTELANQNPELKAQFKVGRVEEVIADLRDNEYDLVLGLSVFHHIIHEMGIEQVQALLNELAMKSGALILELALQEEPLYWGPSQPSDPRTLLNDISFIHRLMSCATHLSTTVRPLYVASNYYWIFGEKAERFDEVTKDPHALARGTHQGSRTYFFSENFILKQLFLGHPERGILNRDEFQRELDFLSIAPAGFPQLVDCTYGKDGDQAWVARPRLSGELLLDLLLQGARVNHRQIIISVLEQLSKLESVGLYHNDLRVWNILVEKSNRVHLIDYGSISANKKDCVWPRNIYLAFFIFVKEVVSGEIDSPSMFRGVISPLNLPKEYQDWAVALWMRPLNEWSFHLMYQTLADERRIKNMSKNDQVKSFDEAIKPWVHSIEEEIKNQISYIKNLEEKIQSTPSFTKRYEQALADADARILYWREISEKISQDSEDQKRALTQTKTSLDDAYANIAWLEGEKNKVSELLDAKTLELTQTKTSLDDAYANIAWLEGEKNKVSELLDAKTLELTQTKTSLDDAYANIAWLEGEKNKVSELLDAKTLELTQTKTSLDDAYANIAWLEGEKNKVSELLDAKTLELTQTKTSLDDAYANIAWLEGEKNKVSESYTKILASTSWKITRPIRVAKRILIMLLRVIRKAILLPFFAINYFLIKLFNKISIWLHKRPILRYKCINFLNKFPSLKYKLKLILTKSNHSQLLSKQISLSKESPQHISDHKFQKISGEEPNVSSDVDAILLIIKGKLDRGIGS